jgi:hypothetical protein
MKYCCSDVKPTGWNYCPYCGAKIDEVTEQDEKE